MRGNIEVVLKHFLILFQIKFYKNLYFKHKQIFCLFLLPVGISGTTKCTKTGQFTLKFLVLVTGCNCCKCLHSDNYRTKVVS